jgi:hypothetical protein
MLAVPAETRKCGADVRIKCVTTANRLLPKASVSPTRGMAIFSITA